MGNSDGFIPWQIFLAISFYTLQPGGIWQLSYSKPLEVLLEQKKLAKFCSLLHQQLYVFSSRANFDPESLLLNYLLQMPLFFSGILKMFLIHKLVLIRFSSLSIF